MNEIQKTNTNKQKNSNELIKKKMIKRNNNKKDTSQKESQQQAKRFYKTLQFLRYKPNENIVQDNFLQKVKVQSYLTIDQLNDVLKICSMDSKLKQLVITYFTLVFKHKTQQNTHNQIKATHQIKFTHQIKSNPSFIDQINKKSVPKVKVQANLSNQVHSQVKQKIYNQIVHLSSYAKMKVKILIEIMFLLKDIFEQAIIHKQLINQFEKNNIIKKFQVLDLEDTKQKKVKRKLSMDTFKTIKTHKTIQILNQIDDQSTEFSFILRSKIYTILVLTYEKLDANKFQQKNLNLLKKTLQQRQKYLAYLEKKIDFSIQIIRTNEKQKIQYFLNEQNISFYLIIKELQIKIQFGINNQEHLILKDLKNLKKKYTQLVTKNTQKVKLLEKLQSFQNHQQDTNYEQKQPMIDLLASRIKFQRLFIFNLDKMKQKIKQTLTQQLLGTQFANNLKQKEKQKSQKLKNSQNNLKRQYQLAQSVFLFSKLLTNGNKYHFKANSQLLDKHINNHYGLKNAKDNQLSIIKHIGQNQNFQSNKNRNISTKQLQSIRSTTLAKKNLHKNLFRHQQNEFNQQKNLIKNRTRSNGSRLFRSNSKLKKPNDIDNSKKTSINKLLESPLGHQLQIFFEYQKLVKKQQQQQQLQAKRINDIQSQQNTMITKYKVNQKGMKLHKQMSKFKNSSKYEKKQLTNAKKRKIHTIYKTFAYNNKIIDISQSKLKQQIHYNRYAQIFNKNYVHNLIVDTICNFGGTKDSNKNINQILPEKYLIDIPFVKLWQSKPYFYRVKLAQDEKNFQICLHMNDRHINIVFPKSDNLLCQRYVTIWPTIRYLFQKKIFQFPMIKHFQTIFYQKKNFQKAYRQNNLKQNQKGSFSRNNSLVHNLYGHNGGDFIRERGKKQVKKVIEDNFECQMFQNMFGNIQSEEMQQLNSCFDYFHLFLSLILSAKRKENGKKDIVLQISDTSSIEVVKRFQVYHQKNQSIEASIKNFRHNVFSKKIAKSWVCLDRLNELHLIYFIKKKSIGNSYFFKISIDKKQIISIFQTYLTSGTSQTQKFVIDQQRLSKIPVQFIVDWSSKTNLKDNTRHTKLIKISMQRLYNHKISIQYFTASLLNMITDNYYQTKFCQLLHLLFYNSLFLMNSISGDEVFDIHNPQNTNLTKFFVLKKTNTLIDFYKYDKILHKKTNCPWWSEVFNIFKYAQKCHYSKLNVFKGSPMFNSTNKQVQTKNMKENQNQEIIYQNTVDQKIYSISIIQNFLDVQAWHVGHNTKHLKKNSKWKIVQRKFSAISLISHFLRQKKHNILAQAQIIGNDMSINIDNLHTKQKSQLRPLMLKNLHQIKKSYLTFLQKIQGQTYRAKITIIQNQTSQGQSQPAHKKWLAQCLLIKDNTKQYQKFYISSSDADVLFKDNRKTSAQITQNSFSFDQQSSSWLNKKSQQSIHAKNKSSKLRFRTSLKQSSLKNQQQTQNPFIYQKSKKWQQIKFSNLRQQDEHDHITQERTDKKLQQTFKNLQECIYQSNCQIKQKRKKLFRKIIKNITFTRIKCFRKILIQQQSLRQDSKIVKYMAQPRTSLQILSKNGYDKKKMFTLKYLTPFQNCYQTIICKPIKIHHKKRIDYVLTTLFKIQLANDKLYQFRINLNKNQTYYACQLSQKQLKQLIQSSSIKHLQKSNKNQSFPLNDVFRLFVKQGLINNSHQNKNQQSHKQNQYKSTFYQASSNILFDDINHGRIFQKRKCIIADKKPSLLSQSQINILIQYGRKISMKSAQYHGRNIFLSIIINRLEQFSKEILRSIFQQLQIKLIPGQDISEDELIIEIPNSQFKKVLRPRILQRISKDKKSIHMIQFNQSKIRKLNKILLKTSMNNTFNIFEQNIFKRQIRNQQDQMMRTINYQQRHQSDINLLFSSFYLYNFKPDQLIPIKEMNQDYVLENIEYQFQKKYGKQSILQSSSKKILNYSQIFLNYYLKYLSKSHRNQNNNQKRIQQTSSIIKD